MATLVQSAPVSELQFRQQHFPRQQNQSTQLSYTAAVPVEQTETSGPGNVQPTLYKQINVIPGLDADNAVVDTGIKLVRPTGGQVQVSSNTAAANANDFDGKRMRRSIQRRTVDYNASALQMLKHRLYKKSLSQKPIVHPDPLYYIDIVQPRSVLYNPINSVTSRFVRASTNKIRCPVFTVAEAKRCHFKWTPEGRRVVTGTSSGEFTLWNGLTFNFETILQAHDSAVRAMEWSHNDMWLLSGDHNGVIKYWQSNMNNVKMMQAHTDPIRGLSFCPTDNKFVTCSDDGLLKVWDFYRCQEERVLRGHGADVKCCGWHPSKSLIVSGSKDSQQPLKLWDPRSGTSLATIHGHKSTVMDLQWNKNGNWILTGSRDRLLKVFDIRAMKDVYTFRGHKKEAASVNWHPLYENMFASGGSDGSIMFWLMGCEKELGVMDCAHDGMIWDLKWHPLGHILCSGSNDHTTKFWTRNRPADKMRDKYNLNILPSGFEDDYEYELPDSSQSNGMLCESVVSSVTCDNPEKGKSGDEKTDITKSNLNTPAVKALLEQASLEVFKPDSSDPPAQIYTLSQLRPTAPAFKIDSSKQKEAIDEVERLEKRRERQLRKGADKASLDSDDDATCNAPSLLDLDIAPPAFLKEQEMKEQSMQFSNGINQGALLPNIPPHMREKASPRREAPPPRQPYMEEENRNFEGPMRSSHVMRADGPPNFERNPGHPEFNRPPPDAPHFDRPSTSGPPIFDRPPSNGPPNFTRPAHNPPPSSANRFNGKRSGDDYMDESRPNEHFNSRPGSGDFGARSRLDGEFNDGPPPRSAPIFDNRPPADSNGPMPVEDFPNRRRPGGEMLDVPPRSAGDKRPRLDGDFNRSMQRLGGEFNLRPLPEDDFKRNGNFDKRPQSKETFVHRPGVESGRFDRDMHRVPSDGMDGPHVRFNKNEPPSRLHEEPRPHQFNGPVRFDGPCIDNRGPPSAPPLRNAPFDGPPNPHPRDGLIPEKRWLDQRVSGRWQDERVRSRRPNDMDNIDEPGPNWENMERDDRERIR